MPNATPNGQPETSCVQPALRVVTTAHAKRYPFVWDYLRIIAKRLDSNASICDELRHLNKDALADRIHACQRIQSGNSPDYLKTDYYCKQALHCDTCASDKATKRANHAWEACEVFSGAIDRSELRIHKFLITPKSHSGQQPMTDLKVRCNLLRKFREALKSYHATHNVRMYLDGKKSVNRLKATLGPSIGSLHIVPAKAGHNDSLHIHMHYCVVTSAKTSKRYIEDIVRKLWIKTCAGSLYEPQPDDVSRHKLTREPNGQPRIWAYGDFFPSQNHNTEEQSEDVYKHFIYLGKPLKKHWTSADVVNHADLCRYLGLDIRSLHQFLGKQETSVQEPPGPFDSERLNHRYVAAYIGKKWRVIQKPRQTELTEPA